MNCDYQIGQTCCINIKQYIVVISYDEMSSCIMISITYNYQLEQGYLLSYNCSIAKDNTSSMLVNNSLKALAIWW